MRVNETSIHVEIGDYTLAETEAIVFYATDDLKLGTGFGNAIAMRGGPSVQEELNKLAPLPPTEAVISSSGDLPAKHIIHANGPKFQEEDRLKKLEKTLENALKVAKENGIRKIVFPPMGAGFYGIPLPDCAKTMVNTFLNYALRNKELSEIRIVVMNKREYQPFAELLHEKEVAA